MRRPNTLQIFGLVYGLVALFGLAILGVVHADIVQLRVGLSVVFVASSVVMAIGGLFE